ncbi:MAG: hypothetical protein AAFY12_11675 [Pseudomonadota bacterium]
MADGQTATIGHNSAAIGQMLRDEPEALFREPSMLKDLVSEIDEDINEFEYDLATDSGRKAIASMAYKIAQLKTKLDGAGKDLTEEKRKQIDSVNEVRRDVRNKLDDLKAKARQPLDDWEARQKQIKATIEGGYIKIAEIATIPHGSTSEQIMERLGTLQNLEFDIELIGPEQHAALNREIQEEMEAVQELYDREIQAEKDREELARLKAEQEEKERLQREADAKAAAEKAEAERAERMKQEAEVEAKRKADAEAQAKIEEAERKQREAEQALADKKAEEDRIAAEDAKRQRDQEHRSRVMRAAKEAIMEHGSVDEASAKAVVLAIGSGSVPNVSIKF